MLASRMYVAKNVIVAEWVLGILLQNQHIIVMLMKEERSTHDHGYVS